MYMCACMSICVCVRECDYDSVCVYEYGCGMREYMYVYVVDGHVNST